MNVYYCSSFLKQLSHLIGIYTIYAIEKYSSNQIENIKMHVFKYCQEFQPIANRVIENCNIARLFNFEMI